MFLEGQIFLKIFYLAVSDCPSVDIRNYYSYIKGRFKLPASTDGLRNKENKRRRTQRWPLLHITKRSVAGG